MHPVRKELISFLAAEGLLPPGHGTRIQETLRVAPEPIGAIAFRYGMLSGGEIDEILDRQRHCNLPFGELAIEQGVLTENQLENLLRVQQMRAACEAAEALILSGVCSFEDVTVRLGRFLASQPAAAGTRR